jgi:hypothetical protein
MKIPIETGRWAAIVHDILIAFLSFYIHLGYYKNMAVCIYTSTDLKLSQGNFTWLCKLRTCNMKIPIETGRWENIPKEKILCKFCNDGIGDEFHYLFNILPSSCFYWNFHIASS